MILGDAGRWKMDKVEHWVAFLCALWSLDTMSCFTSDGLDSGIPNLIVATVAFET
jgi:hypothetical protein